MAFCEKNMNPEEFAKSKRIKSDLKWLVSKMKSYQEREYNLKKFGSETPKLADIISGLNLIEEDKGNIYHPIYNTFVKKEGYNPTMQK